jgi:hypothetical protein
MTPWGISAGLAFAVFAALGPGAVNGADFSDPTWPCIQRKVESLSLGLMWPHPLTETDLPAPLQAEAEDLVERLALRRIGLDEADALIAGFAAGHPDLTVEDLGQVFARIFDRIDRERRTLIAGIGRYSLKQIDLAASIDQTRTEMAAHMEAAEPYFDEVDRLEEKLDWDERIYDDRADALTYVCETPVLLEQRAFALAQSFLKHAD